MERSKRVKSKEDFQKVISSKQKIYSDAFVIYYLKRKEYDYSRFGIAASKKMGGAVIRVRIRRQVRSMLREINLQSILQPMDYVIIVRKPYEQNDYRTNLQELKKMFTKFGGQMSE